MTTTAVVFDGITLTSPEPPEEEPDILLTGTRLLSGKVKIQASAAQGYRANFKCHTATLSDITNLQAKIGTAGTLTIDGTAHTKCYISSFRKTEAAAGKWIYEVSFIQDTT
jgi:hypothetical protein